MSIRRAVAMSLAGLTLVFAIRSGVADPNTAAQGPGRAPDQGTGGGVGQGPGSGLGQKPAQGPGPGPGQGPGGAPGQGPGGPSQQPPPPPRPDPRPDQKAEDYYKNVQVFKGIPAEQLVPAMQFIAASLDVECSHCHVRGAPDKDDKKEKQTARKMITMMRAINKDNFGGERKVTCMSCHHGSTHPLTVPAIAPLDSPQGTSPPPPESKPEAALPAPETILDAYLKAAGGAEALAKVTSRVSKGSLSGLGPQPIPVEILAKAPNKRVSIVHGGRGDNLTAFDGHAGWLGGPGGVHEMSAAENDIARLDADIALAAHARQLFKEFKTLPPQKIAGADANGLLATREGAPPVELWFDAQSGLLVRMVRFVETPLGPNPTQVDYADYRETGGVKIPYKWTVGRPSGSFTIAIQDVQQNVPVEDSRFEKPPPPPPQPPPLPPPTSPPPKS